MEERALGSLIVLMENWLKQILNHPKVKRYNNHEGAAYQCAAASVTVKGIIKSTYPAMNEVRLVACYNSTFPVSTKYYITAVCPGHTILKIGDLYYDFTIRQFIWDYPEPVAIYTHDEFVKLWEEFNIL